LYKVLESELLSREDAVCSDILVFLAGGAAPYQSIWRLQGRAGRQEHRFVTPRTGLGALKMFFWNRKSRAFSRKATGPFISSSRQKSTMSGIRLVVVVVVVVDDGN